MKGRLSPPLRLLRRFFRSIESNGFRGALVHSCRRLFRSLKNHGVKGTFERAFVKAPEAPPIVFESRPHPFDMLHGTETCRPISVNALDWQSFSAVFVNGYLGIAPSTLRPALAELPIQHQEFSFIDIGCGKGRALFIAAELPFRQLIGVELSGELCEVARSNVARDPAWTERISIVNQDATNFNYPEGPLVLFFYYPFYAAVFRRVLKNLERQLRRSPRPAYLLYADFDYRADDESATAPHQEVLSSCAFLRKVSESAYSLSPEDAAAEPSSCTANRFSLHIADVAR